MPAPELHVDRAVRADLEPVLAAIRGEFDVPAGFAPEVLAEAEVSARSGGGRPPGADETDEDLTDLAFVTIDPEGSRDLDQAYLGERRAGGGFRIHYAIADVAWFVAPGGAVDQEAHRRGLTLYLPDERAPLYPEAISQGAASLLPEGERRALVWTIDLDADANPVGGAGFRRGVVRSRRQMSYVEAQAEIDDGRAGDSLLVLRDVGRLREQREADRGGISLRLPDQDVEVVDGRTCMSFAASLPVEGWNAQISLLTGIVAAGIMLEHRLGILRTLPAPDDHVLDELRQQARAMGIDWPADVRYPDFVRGLDPADTTGAVLLNLAARTLRGAGYTAFDGAVPDDPVHAAVASPYAHVTAPLRRLADRQTNEVLLALVAGVAPPPWARDGLTELAATMEDATRRERSIERAVIDGAEAVLLAPRQGERFEATVIAVDTKRSRATIQLADPAVIAPLDGTADVGARITARLVEVDPVRRTVRFEPAA